MHVEHKGSLQDTLVEMEQDLQSSISYAGGNTLESIRNVDYVIVKKLYFQRRQILTHSRAAKNKKMTFNMNVIFFIKYRNKEPHWPTD